MFGKKNLLALLLATLMVLTLAACGGGASSSAAPAAESTASSAAASAPGDTVEEEVTPEGGGEGAYTIGYVCKHQLDDFMQTLRSGAEEYAEEIGVNLIFMSTEKHSDVEKQVQLTDDMILQGVDALCLVATDPTALIPSIIKANEAGIPVILVNDTIDDESAKEQGAEYVTYVGTDNYQGGLVGGEFVAEQYPDGAKVAIVAGTPGNPAGDARVDGFKEGVASNANIEVIAEQPTDWSRDQGFSVTQNILTANPDVTVIYCPADLMALGALEAIDQAGMSGQVKVLGFDGSVEAQESILAGQMLGSVAQYPAEMSQEAIDAAITVLEGGTVEPVIHTTVEVMTKELLESRL